MKKEIVYHRKGGPNKTKEAQWTQMFSTEKKEVKIKEGERENEQKYRKKDKRKKQIKRNGRE